MKIPKFPILTSRILPTDLQQLAVSVGVFDLLSDLDHIFWYSVQQKLRSSSIPTNQREIKLKQYFK